MAPGVVFEGSESNNSPDASGGSDVPQPPPPPSSNNGLPTWRERQQSIKEPPTPEVCDQFTNLPAALINSLKREKKPFTYTPGGIDLSEIKSPRMQKRLAANKKLQGVISPLARPPESLEAQKELLVKPVYNSPLNLYSMPNAKEELQKQASLLTQELESMKISPNGEIVRSHSFGQEGFPKYSQSKSFRLLQLMTDTRDVHNESGAKRKTEDDEMTFSGISKNPIPSKFFQTLQRITGTDGESPEPQPPLEFEHWGDPCTLQTASYEKDFVPAPKPYSPFDRRDFNEISENSVKKSQINIQVGGNYTEPTYHKQELQHQNQPMYQRSEPDSENQAATSGYQKQSSNTYKQKNPQPYIRPNFQAKDVATSNSWQPFNHPYNYCTLPRTYRGLPDYEGTDL